MVEGPMITLLRFCVRRKDTRERFCVYTMDHLNFLYLECKSDYFRILMLVMGEGEEKERERERERESKYIH